VIEKHDLELIVGWYLVPYATAAFLASSFTQRPFIVRHAGSDLNRIANSFYFRHLIERILKSADRVITYPSRVKTLEKKGILPYRIIVDRSTSIDLRFFSPKSRLSSFCYLPLTLRRRLKNNVPLITYMGKISVNKGLEELIKSLSLVKKQGQEFAFLVVGDGRKRFKQKFLGLIKELELEDQTFITAFVPPWRVPGIINLSTLLVHPEFNFPIKVHNPILIREIMACGGCLLISRELYQKQDQEFVKEGQNVVVVDPKKEEAFAQKITDLLKKPGRIRQIGKKAREAALKREDFNRHVDQFERFYQEVIEEVPLADKSRKLILFRGPPAVGKTTVSRLLKKKKSDLAVLKFDTLRRNISEVPAPIHRRGITLEMTLNLSQFLLKRGFDVLVEGVFLHQEEIRPFYQLAKRLKVKFLIFEIDASDDILRRRVKSKPVDPLQGGVVNFERALRAFRASKITFDDCRIIRINTDKLSPKEVTEKILKILASC
jgi:glycosyltransferase involved in cell wall biosynthesis/predicted kinase